MLSLGDRAPKAAPGLGREGPGATASTTGVRSPRVPLAAGSDAAASELTRDCVFSMSVVSRRRVSSICRALDGLGRWRWWQSWEPRPWWWRSACHVPWAVTAWQRHTNPVPHGRAPHHRPGPEHRGLRNLLQGPRLTGFSKLRFEPREPGFPASVLKFSTLLPW